VVCKLVGGYTVNNGGGGHITGEPLHPHDMIDFRPLTKDRIIENCAPLYEKGHSLREIQEKTGIPITTIRDTFVSKGLAIRNFITGQNIPSDKTKCRYPGAAPFGYAFLDGQLVLDVKKHLIVRKILKLNQSGKSNQAIADELNNQKLRPRFATKWERRGVFAVIKREQKNKK